MKQIIQKLVFFILGSVVALQVFAQDQEKKLDVDISVNKDNAQWYQQPWVWIVGIAVFVLLLAAILRGSGKKSEA